ncbi:MAG: Lytic transglycosylase [Bacteriovoracaceae bacterium]|nr:Lytic transglycosylase [Bacteriovoracaceae bacterium]
MIDPLVSAPYNEMMETLRRLVVCGSLSVIFLTGCSTKNSGLKSAKANVNPSAVSSSDEPHGNPILFEEEYEAQERGEVPTYDIPMDRNAKVEQWLAYFQGRGRKWFHIWLERSGRYVPVMRKILRDNSMPEDLVNLAMIESGFSSKAYSRARAAGMWQFMKGTGRLYGLKIDFWVDERRDPEKSTLAAARHLKDLYDQFQSWKLAAAAYNAGSGKVSRAIKKYKTEDFWELTKGRYLRPETRHYVPKMIAAALIAKEPEKYGFHNVQFQDPLSYDKIILNTPVNLIVLSNKAGTNIDDLLAINPELNHPVTPPGDKQYELRVPSGTSEKFMLALSSLTDEEKFSTTAHLVRKGDTLARLSKIYAIPASEIMKLNGLKGVKNIKPGQTLIIPVALDKNLVAIGQRENKVEEKSTRGRRHRASKKQAVESVYSGVSGVPTAKSIQVSSRADDDILISKKKVHIVRRGESLWEIAKFYGTSVVEIKQANHMRRSTIWPGRRLKIPA